MTKIKVVIKWPKIHWK